MVRAREQLISRHLTPTQEPGKKEHLRTPPHVTHTHLRISHPHTHLRISHTHTSASHTHTWRDEDYRADLWIWRLEGRFIICVCVCVCIPMLAGEASSRLE